LAQFPSAPCWNGSIRFFMPEAICGLRGNLPGQMDRPGIVSAIPSIHLES
jgi:hypothetical protein